MQLKFEVVAKRLLILSIFVAAGVQPALAVAIQVKAPEPTARLGTITTYVNRHREFKGPLTFKDDKTGILFYVESDGSHVAAIAPDGRLLWIRNPFLDGKLEPYRSAKPIIVEIGKADASVDRQRKARFLRISFDSTQFGLMDMADGRFIFLGQD